MDQTGRGRYFPSSTNLDEWWRFDDSKVTSVPESKIMSLDGGGEADTAYSASLLVTNIVLLYRAKEFPKKS
jgi:ubiquitin carboxyl-terminal hydrolase 14